MEFLSAAAQASDDAEALVLTRRKTSFLMMNRYPYAVGHLMAVPYRKTAELSSLGENEIVELWNLVVHAQALLRKATRAQGFNVGLNLGECAGAGVTGRPHLDLEAGRIFCWVDGNAFVPVAAVIATTHIDDVFPVRRDSYARQLLAIVAPDKADAALKAMRNHPLGREAAIIGAVQADPPGMVFLRTDIGGMRVLDMLVGDPLPRIC